MVYFQVPAAKYEKAVADGVVQAGLFGEDGKVSQVVPGAEALAGLVDEDQKRAAIEKYYVPQEKMVRRGDVDELGALSDEARKELPGLLEAYDFTDGGKDIRLLNLSNTRLSDEQLRKVANAIRSFSDKSGGELYDKLRTIIIVPEDNPAIMAEVEDEDGKFMAPHQGEAKWGERTLILSERAVQKAEDRKPRSDRVEAYWRNRYNAQLLPGEPEEGPGSRHYNVARWDIERLTAHELEHISLPPNNVPLEGVGPTKYSGFNKREHEAELGALEYIGWQDAEAALDVPEAERQAKIEDWEQQRAAKQEMWNRQRGTNDGGRSYEAPLGPRFVACRELDVTKVLPPRPKYFEVPASERKGDIPLPQKYRAEPLLTEINYRLKPEDS